MVEKRQVQLGPKRDGLRVIASGIEAGRLGHRQGIAAGPIGRIGRCRTPRREGGRISGAGGLPPPVVVGKSEPAADRQATN